MTYKRNISWMTRAALLLCLAWALAGRADAAEGAKTEAKAATSSTATAASCAAAVAPAGVVFDDSPRWQATSRLPPHCEIRGLAAGKIRFVMRLPAAWEGRFLLAGCGGFCGELQPDKEGLGNAINVAVRRGYAAISHDGGHQAASWETSWAEDAEALEIWAHKVLPLMTQAGVDIAKSVYGIAPRYKYFSGCSNGGRLGMMAAQRYPGLFDGIAAGASIFDLSGTAGLWGAWMTQQTLPEGKPVIAPERWAVVHRKVLQRCDALDGQRDGRIDTPRACTVDFSTFTSGDEPLTAAEASALTALYGGVRDASGAMIYPALELGSEFFGDIWLGGSEARAAWGTLASRGYRQMLARSLGHSPGDVPADVDAVRDMIARSPVPAITDAVDTDLAAHARSGSKLLIYHGLADPLIIPRPLENYYATAAERAGGLAALRQHTRLFMIPGWGHCWERPATAGDDFDPLAAVEAWVERGQAPDSLPLRSRDGQRVEQIPMR